LTGTSNRGGSLANIRLPESFGNALGGRRLGTLNEAEIELLQRLARAAHRDGNAIRTYKQLWWRKAVNEMKQKGTR